jgi:hypothetical protein
MPAIRCRYNGGCFILSPKIKYGKHPLCGETVQVIQGDDWERLPFTGFTSIDALLVHNALLITGIDAFTPGDEILGAWYEFSQRDWLLACQSTQNGVSLIVNDGKPIIVGQSELYSRGYHVKYTNNVSAIGSAKTPLMRS